MLCLLVLTSFRNAETMTPVEYNDAIIGEQTKITKAMIEMANYFAPDIEKSELLRKELVKQCDASIAALKKLPAYEGDTKFRDAGVNLFQFYKEISAKEYKEMIDILRKENIQTSDIDRLTVLEEQISKREQPLDEAFQKAQEAFAKKHNLSLYENEVQDKIDQLGK